MVEETETNKERFPPPPNLPPPGASLSGRLLFALQGFADLQKSSVLHYLVPWLSGLSGKVLEVGCGAQPYRHLLPPGCAYQGLDWEQAEEHFAYRAADATYYHGSSFPFEDHSFDHLFHTEVLEHVYEKENFLAECHRVLKPGGTMFLAVPFQARYHYIPYDYWRFTPAALVRLLEGAGFTDTRVMPRGTDITVAAYKNLSLIFRCLSGGLAGQAVGLAALPLALLFVLVGQITLRLRWGSPDDCLGYVATARA